MSIPDLIEAKNFMCFNLFARSSEFENPCDLKPFTLGVSINSRTGDLSNINGIIDKIEGFSNIFVKLPELHGFKKEKIIRFWESLKMQFLPEWSNKNLMLCTDKTFEVKHFFQL